eukprot:10522933-Alexandrium_andersonii.AAC.1
MVEAFGLPSCPMRSRRAPELAAGQLEVFLDELASESNASLVVSLARLPSSEQTTALEDFAAGRRHLVKLSRWQQLPFALRG